MGCNGSKQNVKPTKSQAGNEILELKKKHANNAPAPVCVGWAPIAVGESFDTPYGKGVVEELKAGENKLTYAIVKLSSGFVSITEEQARQWKAKASAIAVGDAFRTPYGKGTVKEVKRGEESDVIYAIVHLETGGFVSVPEALAGNWKAASTSDEATAIGKAEVALADKERESEKEPEEEVQVQAQDADKKEPTPLPLETMEADILPAGNPKTVDLDNGAIGDGRCRPLATCLSL